MNNQHAHLWGRRTFYIVLGAVLACLLVHWAATNVATWLEVTQPPFTIAVAIVLGTMALAWTSWQLAWVAGIGHRGSER